MSCKGMPDITKPLACPKCGKEPQYTKWERRGNGNIIHQIGCCMEVGVGRRHTKQSAAERWNTMVLEYAMREAKGE